IAQLAPHRAVRACAVLRPRRRQGRAFAGAARRARRDAAGRLLRPAHDRGRPRALARGAPYGSRRDGQWRMARDGGRDRVHHRLLALARRRCEPRRWRTLPRARRALAARRLGPVPRRDLGMRAAAAPDADARRLSSRVGPASQDFPYTGTTAPRVTLLSGEARNRIVRATSSTVGQAAWSALGMSLRLVGVSRTEGATAFTRMFLPTTSSASAIVRVATAALLAA